MLIYGNPYETNSLRVYMQSDAGVHMWGADWILTSAHRNHNTATPGGVCEIDILLSFNCHQIPFSNISRVSMVGILYSYVGALSKAST